MVRIFAQCVVGAIDRNDSSLPTHYTSTGSDAVNTAGMVHITEIRTYTTGNVIAIIMPSVFTCT